MNTNNNKVPVKFISHCEEGEIEANAVLDLESGVVENIQASIDNNSQSLVKEYITTLDGSISAYVKPNGDNEYHVSDPGELERLRVFFNYDPSNQSSKPFTVIAIVDESGQIVCHHVMAKSELNAFAVLAEKENYLSMVAVLPGHVKENRGIAFPGDSLVDSETILGQPDVFGEPGEVKQTSDSIPPMDLNERIIEIERKLAGQQVALKLAEEAFTKTASEYYSGYLKGGSVQASDLRVEAWKAISKCGSDEFDKLLAEAMEKTMVDGWRNELLLIESVLKGYPVGMAQQDALRAIRKLLSVAVLPENEKSGNQPDKPSRPTKRAP